MTFFSLIYWYFRSYFGRIDYHSYLNSRAWKFKRKIVLWWASNRCQLCFDKDRLETHHRTYKRLGRERLTDLTILCHHHHEMFHNLRRYER